MNTPSPHGYPTFAARAEAAYAAWARGEIDQAECTAAISAALLESAQPQPQPRHLEAGANAEDCPACDRSRALPYPFLCPGDAQATASPADPPQPAPGVIPAVVAEAYSVVPQHLLHDPEEALPYRITVSRCGSDRWEATRNGSALNAAGQWERCPARSERDEHWLQDHTFDRATAIELARRAVTELSVRGYLADGTRATSST